MQPTVMEQEGGSATVLQCYSAKKAEKPAHIIIFTMGIPRQMARSTSYSYQYQTTPKEVQRSSACCGRLAP